MTLDQCKIIQSGIENRSNKVDVARRQDKDAITIAREIRAHRMLRPRYVFNNHNLYIHLEKRYGCPGKCDRYAEPTCPGRDRFTVACNYCRIKTCRLG